LTSRIVRNSVVLVVLAVFGLAVLWTFMGEGDTATDYPYGQLIEDARAGVVTEIVQEGQRVTATVNNAERRRRNPHAPDLRPAAGPPDRRVHLLHDAPGPGHQ
jgi:hypothetical protein